MKMKIWNFLSTLSINMSFISEESPFFADFENNDFNLEKEKKNLKHQQNTGKFPKFYQFVL